MLPWLKYTAFILVAVVFLYGITRINECANAWRGIDETTVVTPADSTFAPTTHRSHDPSPLLPGVLTTRRGEDPPPRLPRGIRATDVERVVSVKYKGRNPVHIIELVGGQVFVEKEDQLESVTVTEYRPTITWGVMPGIGLSVSPETVSPAASVSFFELWQRLRFPVVADLDGIGIGAQWKLYHDIYAGGAMLWKYEDASARMIKATLSFNF